MGVYALAAGTLGGALIELALLQRISIRHGLNLLPAWHGMSADLRYALRQYLPMVAATVMMSSSLFVDQAMAASLGPGSVSSYAYGTRAVAATVGIMVIAVSTAVFPHFSKLLAVDDYQAVRREALKYGFWVFVGAAAVAAMFVVGSRQITQVLFVRGAFTNTSAELASTVQSLYALQMPFYVSGLIGVRLLSAMAENKQLLWMSGINLLVDVVGNLIFMRWFGIAGIALSTSLVYVLAFVMIWGTVWSCLKRKPDSSLTFTHRLPSELM
jgi:putative peptidoglycan lipid II flippase